MRPPVTPEPKWWYGWRLVWETLYTICLLPFYLAGGLPSFTWTQVGKAYYWFWHDVCKRPEPFTHTMRRSTKEHPLWWILTPIMVGSGYYLLVCHLAGWF